MFRFAHVRNASSAIRYPATMLRTSVGTLGGREGMEIEVCNDGRGSGKLSGEKSMSSIKVNSRLTEHTFLRDVMSGIWED